MSNCAWPFHNEPGCPSCARWEERAGDNLDRYLERLAAAREAAKEARKGGQGT